MTSKRTFLRRRRLPIVGLVLAVAALTYSIVAGAATPIPFPEPLVKVTTKSGVVTKTHYIPIGGAPIPIDVDGPAVTGILEPDIDVSIGLVALDELPGSLIVPNVVVTRNALAVATNRPAPPLDFDAEIVLRDLNDSARPFVNVHYGFSTPPNARVPQRLSAKLVGPIAGGFIDPLQAKIEAPGYNGPLNIKISALTADLDAKFALNFDSLPESIFISEDPREDGLDVLYKHNAPVNDVHLDAFATLRNRTTNELLEIGAQVERLPQTIALSNTNTANGTQITYDSSSALSKPDLTASYRDLDGDGNVVTDAKLDVAGLPFRMGGDITTVPNEEGGSDIDAVDFAVEEGDQIDSVDFEVRNFAGPAGAVPAPVLNPEQHIAFSSRFIDGAKRSRAAGRLLGIRSAQFEMQGEDNDIIDARTDLGDGVRPLRALVDIDDRDDPSVPDEDDKRLAVDARVAPLPEQIHAIYDPSTETDDNLRLFYESTRSIDIDADATIANGPADGCGEAEVLCAKARVDDMPTEFEAFLPGEDGTDFVIRHNGTATEERPDVTATVDTTNVEAERSFADVRIDRVPPKVDGRLDTKNEVLRSAEFHGCDFDFAPEENKCVSPTTAEALGRVRFTVRDRPDRGDLPPREDTADQFVSLIKRDERFEATGRVDEVRNVVFHQRDDDEDGEADGTLGALVDAGTGGPFDAVIDDVSDALDPDDETEPFTVLGKGETKMRVGVTSLPEEFSVCVRENAETPVPDPDDLSPDGLLEPCDRDDVLDRDPGELDVTPLSILYTASTPTKVTARIESEAPDKDDEILPATDPKTYHRAKSVFDTTVTSVPKELRTDVISPVTPDPDAVPPVESRKLELDYDASHPIGQIDFEMESRRADSLCEDPRPARSATCLNATIKDLPADIFVSYDPDEAKGDIEFRSSPPAAGDDPLSFDPLVLSRVSPEPDSQPLLLTARVLGITPRMTGQIIQLHTPTDPPGEKSLGKMVFNACPDGGSCDGIDEIDFTATNTLIGDPLPAAPPKDADTSQDFTFVQRGTDFRAKGKITKLKEIGLSKLKTDNTPSATTKVRASFGDGTSAEKLRAYVDRITVTDPETNTGLEEQVAHAVISEAPEAINICFRDKLEPPNVPEPQNSETADFCDKAQAEKLAVQARLDVPDEDGAKPDIDIRRLRLAKGGGTDFLEGTAFIRNLAERIDVLAGKGEDTDILIEGHNLDDGPTDPPENVADRVKFDFRNYVGDDTGTGQFPFVSLNGAVDPQDDTRVDAAGGEENFAKVVKDVNDMLLKGSIPDIKRIALTPGPCDPGDTARFPAVSSYADPQQAPEYTCVNLLAAQNQPLGLAIRTKDAKGEILSMDEGYISSIPGGEGGLFATLGKAPDDAKLNPVCGVGGAGGAQNCRPPLLSVKAPKADGQTSNLQMRMAIGDQTLVDQLKDEAPLDVYSKRLEYEQAVKDYTVDPDGAGPKAASKGIRLKLGTGEVGTAVRLGANIDLPNFFDMDPPTSYSCKRDDIAGGPLDPDSAACKQSDVSAKDNHGFESKDIAIRVVGANNQALGTDLPSLGRAAVFVHSFDDGKQTLITGAFPADSGNSGRVADDPTTSAPETAYTEGPWDLGVDLPGHLDARIFIRNKFEAGEDDKQTTYYQVDGRVNTPLSMTLRDVQSPALDNKTLLTGQTRDGKAVSALNLALRNAAGLGNGVDNFDKPTFRLRAEMRKPYKEPDEGPYACEGFNAGGDRTAGFGANFCIYVPGDHIEKWLDVGLNMNPDEGGTPARTVDVVMDSKDYTQIDMRSFAHVNGSGDPEAEGISKGAGAEFTPQAGLRLQPFPIGLEIGLGLGIVGGNTKLLLDGDLILKLTGKEIDRLRLSQNKGAMRILAEDGDGDDDDAYIKTHDLTRAIVQVRAEALFGLISENVVDVNTDPYHQPVEFGKCFPNLGVILPDDDYFEVTSNDSTKVAISFEPGNIPAEAAAAEVLTAASKLLAPIWCLFGTEDNKLVNDSHPAPAFDEPGRPISDQSFQPPEDNPPAEPAPEQPADLTVANGETITLCGTPGFRTLTVQNGGVVRAGLQGTSVNETRDLDGPGGEPPQTIVTPCDGSLQISADQVIVEPGGTISADGVRTTLTPGGGTGGGAGHSGSGGGSGSGGAGGTTTAVPSGGPLADFGFRGRDGANGGVGGNGGGTIAISAANYIQVDGVIRANGLAGSGATGACDGAPDDTGGGGGSGGHVALTANLVAVSGDVEARGGNGDFGGHGGGGGGGGRITVNSVDPRPASGDLEVNGGTAGGAGTDCNPGGSGGSGNNTLGTTLNFAGGVTFDTAQDAPPTYVENSVPLKVRAIDNNSDRLRVIVCRSSVPLTDPDGLDAAALDPSGASFADLVDNADECESRFFADATTAPNLYEQTFNFDVDDGFHGFFAFAARIPGVDSDSEDCMPGGFDPTPCTYQSIIAGGSGPALPGISTVKVGADDTAPSLAFTNQTGQDCGLGARKCISQPGKISVQSVENTGGIGLSSVFCSVNGGPYDIPCGPGDGIAIDPGTAEGPVDVSIRTSDQLGNTRTIDGPRWFVDRDAGSTPVVTKVETDPTETNGWRQSKPLISVHAEDDLVGFTDNAVTLFTDTSSHACGTTSNVDKTFFGLITLSLPLVIDCSSTQTEPFVPDEGIHTFQAQTTDRLGNVSLKSNIETMKVDGTPPTTAIFLGPKNPDGAEIGLPTKADNWYRTKPFVAFGAVDNVGGSGVNINHASNVSKIEFNVDGEGWQEWDPALPNLLDDGIHEVCYRATDLAGNTSAEQCRSNIKVDSTAPTVDDPISPLAPDGANGWYVSSPSVDGTATDPGSDEDPAPPAERSGVAKVQMQVDGGNWFTATPTSIPEGTHTVRTRSFDVAGNPSPILERRVFVDRSNPSAKMVSFPPAPNSRGWFRRVLKDSIAVDDGRDGSGPAGAAFTVGPEGPSAYLAPFPVPHGIHNVGVQARDSASRQGALVLATQKVDTTAPWGAPVGQTPLLTLPAIGLPKPVPLKWQATNDLPGKVRVQVVVQDVLGIGVRRLDAGWVNQGSGTTYWDGKTGSGRGALPGVYTYRVHVTDEAGNTVLVTESKPFVVILGLLPL